MSGLIKICGLRDPENIGEVFQLKPDFAGLIFHPGSPRFVSDPGKLEFLNHLAIKPKITGVFVNAEISHILQINKILHLDAVQLHGSEHPDTCHKLRESGFTVIKAFGIDGDFNFRLTAGYENSVDYLLFDTGSHMHGGSGKQFDWTLLEKYQGNTPWFLSGGIAPDTAYFPTGGLMAGIDLNSRFEKSPGVKDIKLLKEFIKKIRDE